MVTSVIAWICGKTVALHQRLACDEEVEVDRLFDDLRKPGIDGGGCNGSATGTFGHQQDIAGLRRFSGGQVFGNADCSHTPGEPAPQHHIAADPERRAGNEGHVHCLTDGRDPCSIIEYFCHVAVIGHVDIGEEHDRFCPHHVDIAERCPGHVEPGKVRVIREPGVHAVDGADNIFAAGLYRPGIVHLIDADRCGGLADDPGDLAVGKKISFSPGADPELSHLYAGRFKRQKSLPITPAYFSPLR